MKFNIAVSNTWTLNSESLFVKHSAETKDIHTKEKCMGWACSKHVRDGKCIQNFSRKAWIKYIALFYTDVGENMIKWTLILRDLKM